MTIIDAIIQGIIQGLTEFLPVSSSGHLSLYQYFTGLSSEEGALFSLVLHFGTLIAVVVAFWATISNLIVEAFVMLKLILTGKINWKQLDPTHKMITLLAVSLLPLFFTLIVKDALRYVAIDNDIIIEGLCFIITAVLLTMASAYLTGKKTANDMTYKNALAIGAMQAISPLPGISRSGSTLAVAMLMGLDKSFAISFSFIMGIPAVCAAILLDAKEIISGGMDIDPMVIAIGMITSAVVGLLAIKLLKWLVANNRLQIFAYYTFALGCSTVLIGAIELFFDHPVQKYIMALLI